MDRTIWNDGVEVTQAQLAYENTATAENLIQRFVDGQSMGIASGLTVSVNSGNDLLVDIDSGHGYSPNGDWVELTTSVTGVGLSDYTNGAVNYVCLIYTEVDSRPEAHEVDGTTRNTRATRAARVRVFTQAQLDALPASSENFNVDARDRTLIVASVTANGSGVPLVDDDITNADIPTRILSIVQPTTMTGVEVVSLSSDTATTAERIAAGDSSATANASLQMTYSAPNILLAYRAPGDTAFGTAQDVTAGGTLSLASDGGSPTMVVRVVAASLPKGDASILPITEDGLTVRDIYDQAVQLTGARDEAHRHLDGATIIPSADNPHGLKVEDLGAVQRVLSTLFTGTSLNLSRGQTMTPHLFTRASDLSTNATTAAGTRLTLVWEFQMAGGATQRVRLYTIAAGDPSTSWGLYLTVNARWIDTGSASTIKWHADDSAQKASLFYVLNFQYAWYGRSAAVSWTDTIGTGGWDQAVVRGSLTGGVSGIVNFLRQINVGSLLLSTITDGLAARVAMSQADTASLVSHTLLFEFTYVGGAAPQKARVYLDNFNALVFTINAIITTPYVTGVSNATWTYDDSTKRASKFYFSNYQCSFQVKESGGATWTDNTWDLPVWLSSASGQYHQTYKTVNAGANILAADYTTPRFQTTSLPAGSLRWLIEEVPLTGWTFRRYAMYDGTDYYTEHALNCVWNGTTWSAVSGATSGAFLYRHSSKGYYQLRRSLPTATWTDTVGVGGWDLQYGVDPYTFATDQASHVGVVHRDMMIAAQMVLTVDTGVFAVESQAVNFDTASLSTSAIYGVSDGLITVPFVKAVTNPIVIITDGTEGGLYSGAGTYRNFQWHAQGVPAYPGPATAVRIWCAQTAPDDATWSAGNVVFEPAIDFTINHASVLRANIVVLGSLTQP